MFGLNKSLLKRLGQFALSLLPQFLETTTVRQEAPSVTVVQTRKTLTNTRTMKKKKGE